MSLKEKGRHNEEKEKLQKAAGKNWEGEQPALKPERKSQLQHMAVQAGFPQLPGNRRNRRGEV